MKFGKKHKLSVCMRWNSTLIKSEYKQRETVSDAMYFGPYYSTVETINNLSRRKAATLYALWSYIIIGHQKLPKHHVI